MLKKKVIDITDVVYNRNKAFRGLAPEKSRLERKGKRQTQSPFEGVRGCSASVFYIKLFMACTKFGTFFLVFPRKSSIFAEKERLWQY